MPKNNKKLINRQTLISAPVTGTPISEDAAQSVAQSATGIGSYGLLGDVMSLPNYVADRLGFREQMDNFLYGNLDSNYSQGIAPAVGSKRQFVQGTNGINYYLVNGKLQKVPNKFKTSNIRTNHRSPTITKTEAFSREGDASINGQRVHSRNTHYGNETDLSPTVVKVNSSYDFYPEWLKLW